MMRRLLYPLFTLIALLTVPAAASAVAPSVTHVAPTNLGGSSVTLNPDVTTGAEQTTLTISYATNMALTGAVTTSAVTVASGADGVVPVNITGLNPSTQYYYRATVSNSTQSNVVDTTDDFTTGLLQLISVNPFSNVTSTTADVSGTVNPNGLATTARFNWGTTTNVATTVNRLTPEVALGSGATPVAIGATLTGLPAFTRIYYVLRTDRDAPINDGQVSSPVQSFVTDRALTAITAKASRVTYNGTSTINGTVTGAGNSGVGLAVQADPYPYNGSYSTVLTGNTGANGAYSLRLGKNTRNTRIRVTTTGTSIVTSSLATLYVQPSVGFITKKQGSRRLLRGTIRPRLTSDGARAKIQRRVGKRWVTVKSLRLTSTSSASSKYSTTVGRRSKKTKYRVQVSPGTSAYATGTSRTRSFK